jgi:hypothetical protein
MVEPLALFELCLSHPSVDVFYSMMLACVGSGCKPRWSSHWQFTWPENFPHPWVGVFFYVDCFTPMSQCNFSYCVESVILSHPVCEGVFSLWLVMSNDVVDVGLWVANLESWTTSLWFYDCMWATCDWRCRPLYCKLIPGTVTVMVQPLEALCITSKCGWVFCVAHMWLEWM